MDSALSRTRALIAQGVQMVHQNMVSQNSYSAKTGANDPYAHVSYWKMGEEAVHMQELDEDGKYKRPRVSGNHRNLFHGAEHLFVMLTHFGLSLASMCDVKATVSELWRWPHQLESCVLTIARQFDADMGYFKEKLDQIVTADPGLEVYEGTSVRKVSRNVLNFIKFVLSTFNESIEERRRRYENAVRLTIYYRIETDQFPRDDAIHTQMQQVHDQVSNETKRAMSGFFGSQEDPEDAKAITSDKLNETHELSDWSKTRVKSAIRLCKARNKGCSFVIMCKRKRAPNPIQNENYKKDDRHDSQFWSHVRVRIIKLNDEEKFTLHYEIIKTEGKSPLLQAAELMLYADNRTGALSVMPGMDQNHREEMEKALCAEFKSDKCYYVNRYNFTLSVDERMDRAAIREHMKSIQSVMDAKMRDEGGPLYYVTGSYMFERKEMYVWVHPYEFYQKALRASRQLYMACQAIAGSCLGIRDNFCIHMQNILDAYIQQQRSNLTPEKTLEYYYNDVKGLQQTYFKFPGVFRNPKSLARALTWSPLQLAVTTRINADRWFSEETGPWLPLGSTVSMYNELFPHLALLHRLCVSMHSEYLIMYGPIADAIHTATHKRELSLDSLDVIQQVFKSQEDIDMMFYRNLEYTALADEFMQLITDIGNMGYYSTHTRSLIQSDQTKEALKRLVLGEELLAEDATSFHIFWLSVVRLTTISFMNTKIMHLTVYPNESVMHSAVRKAHTTCNIDATDESTARVFAYLSSLKYAASITNPNIDMVCITEKGITHSLFFIVNHETLASEYGTLALREPTKAKWAERKAAMDNVIHTELIISSPGIFMFDMDPLMNIRISAEYIRKQQPQFWSAPEPVQTQPPPNQQPVDYGTWDAPPNPEFLQEIKNQAEVYAQKTKKTKAKYYMWEVPENTEYYSEFLVHPNHLAMSEDKRTRVYEKRKAALAKRHATQITLSELAERMIGSEMIQTATDKESAIHLVSSWDLDQQKQRITEGDLTADSLKSTIDGILKLRAETEQQVKGLDKKLAADIRDRSKFQELILREQNVFVVGTARQRLSQPTMQMYEKLGPIVPGNMRYMITNNYDHYFKQMEQDAAMQTNAEQEIGKARKSIQELTEKIDLLQKPLVQPAQIFVPQPQKRRSERKKYESKPEEVPEVSLPLKETVSDKKLEIVIDGLERQREEDVAKVRKCAADIQQVEIEMLAMTADVDNKITEISEAVAKKKHNKREDELTELQEKRNQIIDSESYQNLGFKLADLKALSFESQAVLEQINEKISKAKQLRSTEATDHTPYLELKDEHLIGELNLVMRERLEELEFKIPEVEEMQKTVADGYKKWQNSPHEFSKQCLKLIESIEKLKNSKHVINLIKRADQDIFRHRMSELSKENREFYDTILSLLQLEARVDQEITDAQSNPRKEDLVLALENRFKSQKIRNLYTVKMSKSKAEQSILKECITQYNQILKSDRNFQGKKEIAAIIKVWESEKEKSIAQEKLDAIMRNDATLSVNRLDVIIAEITRPSDELEDKLEDLAIQESELEHQLKRSIDLSEQIDATTSACLQTEESLKEIEKMGDEVVLQAAKEAAEESNSTLHKLQAEYAAIPPVAEIQKELVVCEEKMRQTQEELLAPLVDNDKRERLQLAQQELRDLIAERTQEVETLRADLFSVTEAWRIEHKRTMSESDRLGLEKIISGTEENIELLNIDLEACMFELRKLKRPSKKNKLATSIVTVKNRLTEIERQTVKTLEIAKEDTKSVILKIQLNINKFQEASKRDPDNEHLSKKLERLTRTKIDFEEKLKIILSDLEGAQKKLE